MLKMLYEIDAEMQMRNENHDSETRNCEEIPPCKGHGRGDILDDIVLHRDKAHMVSEVALHGTEGSLGHRMRMQ